MNKLAKFVIYEGLEDEKTIFEIFDFQSNRMLIGSSLDNELALDGAEIGWSHASLELRAGQWVLQDLGTPAGTRVNGTAIAGPYHLQHKDLIEIGHVKLKFSAHDTDDEEDEDLSISHTAPPIKGRVWFATVTGGTVAVIFIILFLLAVAHYLQVINLSELLSFLAGGP